MNAAPQAEIVDLDDAAREELIHFRKAYGAWDRDTKPSTEAAMLRAALPVLRRLEADLKRDDTVKTRTDADALRHVLDEVEHGLDGHGWPSLTTGKAGPGFNLAQRRALAFGFAYIEAARAGKVRDPDPVRTVCVVYARRGKPLSPDSLSRWRRKYDLDTSYYDTVFVGNPEELTDRAKEELRRNSKL